MRTKIAVIGAGFVGSTAAQRIVEKDLGDVVLVDILEGVPQGKALDIRQSAAVEGFSASITGTNDYTAIQGAEVVVVTAGVARKPGMSREDLAKINAGIIADISAKIKENAPDAYVIMVTNPLDIVTYVAWKVTGFPANRVFGMAGVLDTSRYKAFLAMELGINVADIQAMILGGHGDAMVPLVDYTTVAGIPMRKLLADDVLAGIVQRTRKGGGEIVGLLKTGSAYYAPSASAVQMVEAVLKDSKRLLPAAAYLDGQYGLNDLYVGVPVVIGKDGVEKIIELELVDADREALTASAVIIRENLVKLGYRS